MAPQGSQAPSCRLQAQGRNECESLKIGPLAILVEFRAAGQSLVWLHYTFILLVFCALDFPFEGLLS